MNYWGVFVKQPSSDNTPYEKIGDEVHPLDTPFDIPESWEWVRHNDLFEISGGSQPPKSKFISEARDGYIRLYQIRDYGNNPVPVYIPISAASKISHKGDILLARYGASIGKVFWAEDGAYNVAMARVIPQYETELISKEFLFLFYQSSLYQSVIHANSRSAQAGFNKEDLSSLLFPLPPRSEQERIVCAYEKLQPFLDAYDDAAHSLATMNKGFPEALKKSILQEAVQGKLVPQDPSDEPADALLERIREEKQRLIKEGKIKKDKHESVIFRRDNSHYEKRGSEEVCIDEEIPFEIPSGWSWSRFGICLDVRDGTHDTPHYVSEGVPLVTSKNLSNGRIDFSTAKLISREDSQAINQRSKVDSGDIMYAMIGSIGNPVLYQGTDEFSIKNMALFKNIPDGMYMEYVYWFLVLAQEDMRKAASGGVQAFVSLGYLRNYLIPVPPIAEQKRICATIEQALPLLATL